MRTPYHGDVDTPLSQTTTLMNASHAAAFFDLDRTLVHGSSLLALGWPLYRAGFISAKTLLRGGLSQLIFAKRGTPTAQLDTIAQRIGGLFAGIDVAHLATRMDGAVPQYVVPRLYRKSVAILREHQRRGDRVYIVSASPKEIVEPIARYLGVDGVIATVAEVKNGIYTGKVESYCHGPIKAARIREIASLENVDLSRSSAYSDGVSDLPMLESVGHPVCINPDRPLRTVARQRHWQIVKCDPPSRPISKRLPLRLITES